MMMKTTIVVYHKSSKGTFCDDGFAAAFTAWLKFRGTADYIPAIYGESVNYSLFEGRTVYFLDFSYSYEEMEHIASISKSLTVLDHHLTTIEALKGKPYASFCNTSYSGAMIAWRYFHDPNNQSLAPYLIQYIEDNDLWRNAFPATQKVIQRLRLESYQFEAWERLMHNLEDSKKREQFIKEGELLLQQIHVQCDMISQNAFPVILNGVEGLAVNANRAFINELGERLSNKSGTYGAIFHMLPNGEVAVSLRSNSCICDVSKIAQFYGGGGHPGAAGFKSNASIFWQKIIK